MVLIHRQVQGPAQFVAGGGEQYLGNAARVRTASSSSTLPPTFCITV